MDNTGLWIPWFDSCQLITTWMCNIRLYLGSQTSLLWCLRTVGGTVTWLPNFVGWIDLLSYGTTFARQTFWTSTGHLTHRGYYIAACWRYEIFLLVLKKYFTRSLCSLVKYFFNTSREISYLQAAMLCSIYYINTSELPNHFTLIVFWCERRDLLCKITCYFHMWRYQVFARKLTWYFIGVYIINSSPLYCPGFYFE